MVLEKSALFDGYDVNNPPKEVRRPAESVLPPRMLIGRNEDDQREGMKEQRCSERCKSVEQCGEEECGEEECGEGERGEGEERGAGSEWNVRNKRDQLPTGSDHDGDLLPDLREEMRQCSIRIGSGNDVCLEPSETAHWKRGERGTGSDTNAVNRRLSYEDSEGEAMATRGNGGIERVKRQGVELTTTIVG